MTTPEPLTIGALLRHASARLAAAGVEAPRREARLLLTAALGLPRAALLPHGDTPIHAADPDAIVDATRAAAIVEPTHSAAIVEPTHSAAIVEPTHSAAMVDATHSAAMVDATHSAAMVDATHSAAMVDTTRFAVNVDTTRFAAMLARREAREPLALITGRQGFWTLDLAVSPVTLIPRADSEALIEAALAQFPDRAAVTRVLDLGTGTGALLLAALTEFPLAFGVGIDWAEEACRLATANAALAGLAARTAIVRADWSAPLAAPFDLVLANPPYIKTATLAGLMPEVRDYEPTRALDGGPDGLAAYRAILPSLASLLRQNGVAIVELGVGQAAPVATLAARHGLASGEPNRDFAGVERALCLRREPGQGGGAARGARTGGRPGAAP